MEEAGAPIDHATGFGLTTAQIVYRVPDRLQLLQEFIWQEFDQFPDFPALCRFLHFWETQIEGPLHSVTVGHELLVRPTEFDRRHGTFRLH